MDKYEQEVFNFLTQRDNFESMIKVVNHYSRIRKQVLESFWNQVADNLLSRVKEINDYWEIINPPNKDDKNAKLIIYKKLWKNNEQYPFVGVAWERLSAHSYYGVWSDIKSSLINSPKLKQALDSWRNEINFETDNSWWYLWSHGKYDFNIQNDLVFILPDVAASAAEEYADNLLSLLSKAEIIIDTVISNSTAANN